MSAAPPGAGLAVKVAPPRRPAPPAPLRSHRPVAGRSPRHRCSRSRAELRGHRGRNRRGAAGPVLPARQRRGGRRSGSAAPPSRQRRRTPSRSPSDAPRRGPPEPRRGTGRASAPLAPRRYSRSGDVRARPPRRDKHPSGPGGGGGLRAAVRIRYFRCPRLARVNSLKKKQK